MWSNLLSGVIWWQLWPSEEVLGLSVGLPLLLPQRNQEHHPVVHPRQVVQETVCATHTQEDSHSNGLPTKNTGCVQQWTTYQDHRLCPAMDYVPTKQAVSSIQHAHTCNYTQTCCHNMHQNIIYVGLPLIVTLNNSYTMCLPFSFTENMCVFLLEPPEVRQRVYIHTVASTTHNFRHCMDMCGLLIASSCGMLLTFLYTIYINHPSVFLRIVDSMHICT